jgi:hypothetical protein
MVQKYDRIKGAISSLDLRENPTDEELERFFLL